MLVTNRVRLRTSAIVALTALALIVIVLAVVAQGSGSTAEPGEPADDSEVCETTVYEGCPARWDYLFADTTE